MTDETTLKQNPSPSNPKIPPSPPDNDEEKTPPHLKHATYVTNIDEANECLHALLDRHFLNEQDNLLLREQAAHLLVDLITGRLPPADHPRTQSSETERSI
ncbi:MAG: hypothetical protein OXF62_11295 [Caldilineaceae bacterium]|nr:hypothetical protein [Caldilineaceae bacterium]